MSQASVSIIYTGGTIGMVADPRTGQLRPMDLEHLEQHVPELERMNVRLVSSAFERPKDSSDMGPADWAGLARMVAEQYERFDGFVILHGSDTMAYTASALSFLLDGLNKPVVLTGSQLPIGAIRTDGRENLMTAIEIAAAKENGLSVVPEVAVYFEYSLYRGNRTVKVHADRFEAFRSPNWPVLAEAGVAINYHSSAILPQRNGPLHVHEKIDDAVGVIRLYPGIRAAWVRQALADPGLKAAVITTFGSGNGPSDPDFLRSLQEARERGVTLVNVTQCVGGSVQQGRYGTSIGFEKMGMVSGHDITVEAAITKLMFLLGQGCGPGEVSNLFAVPLCGEMSPA